MNERTYIGMMAALEILMMLVILAASANIVKSIDGVSWEVRRMTNFQTIQRACLDGGYIEDNSITCN